MSHIGDNEGMRPLHKSLVREEGEESREKEGEERDGGVGGGRGGDQEGERIAVDTQRTVGTEEEY